MKIGIDVGYSQVKAIAENGKRIIFPSVKAAITSDPTAGMFDSGIGHKVIIKSFSGCTEDLVGEAALRSLTATSTLSRKKSRELHDLFILTAAYLCGVSGMTQIGVGLPLAFYRFQKKELKSRLQTVNAHVQVDDGPEKYISISEVGVYPQGAGILLANGLALAKDGKIGLIDIGYYTTDFLLFELMDGSPVPIAELSGSIDAGIHLVSRALASAYQEKTGSLAPKFLLNDIVSNRPVYFDGEKIDLWENAISSYEKTAAKITQEVLSVWGKQADNISQTILAGGGALLLQKYLNFTNKTMPDDPVFANAEGFLCLLSGLEEDIETK